MLSEVKLKSEKYSNYKLSDSTQIHELKSLNKINIFIGQNNSGKSRFLRTLFSDEDFEFRLTKYDILKIKNFVEEKYSSIKAQFDLARINDADNILSELLDVKENLNYHKQSDTTGVINKLKAFAKKISLIRSFGSYTSKSNTFSTGSPDSIIPAINQMGSQLDQLVSEIFPEYFNYNIHKVYIPILRGLRPINATSFPTENFTDDDIYKLRTIKDYFNKTKTIGDQIFTGLDLYKDVKKMLLGKKEDREKIKNFEEFLSCTFFNNETVTLIPDINNDVLLIGIGDAERSVYEFGDGIQSLIILLYPLFFNQNKDLLVFIEEPETSLHPGMQRIFVEALLRKEFSKFQYFITTHSNHFLDLSLDFNNISIFTFTKNSEKEIIIENVSSGKTKILDLIGVRNSSIFLSNSSIWVEGITDRLYIRKFLDLFHKAFPEARWFQEDLHYSFIEYAGSNITHYAFEEDSDIAKIKASGISNRILLIADSDNTLATPDSAKARRIKKFEEELGENFIKLDVREIENLLNECTVVKVVSVFEKVEATELEYSVEEFKQEKYRGEYLGQYIDTKFSNLKRKYSDGSGTISNKLKFCNLAIQKLESYNDLSEEAKNLTTKIYEFLLRSNKK